MPAASRATYVSWCDALGGDLNVVAAGEGPAVEAPDDERHARQVVDGPEVDVERSALPRGVVWKRDDQRRSRVDGLLAHAQGTRCTPAPPGRAHPARAHQAREHGSPAAHPPVAHDARVGLGGKVAEPLEPPAGGGAAEIDLAAPAGRSVQGRRLEPQPQRRTANRPEGPTGGRAVRGGRRQLSRDRQSVAGAARDGRLRVNRLLPVLGHRGGGRGGRDGRGAGAEDDESVCAANPHRGSEAQDRGAQVAPGAVSARDRGRC